MKTTMLFKPKKAMYPSLIIVCFTVIAVLCLMSALVGASPPSDVPSVAYQANPTPTPSSVSPGIVTELADYRTANSKSFRMSDGSVQVQVSSAKIHYLAGNRWREVDNTLIADNSQSSVFAYRNTANDFQAHFAGQTDPAGSDAALVWLSDGDYAIHLSPLGVNHSTGVRRGSSILYPDAYPNTDLKYIVGNDVLKEAIVVKQPSDVASYQFRLQVVGGELVPLEGGWGFERNGEALWVLAPPYMYDSAEGISEQVTIAVEQEALGQYLLTLTPDESWLKDPARVYPVVIDPTLYQGPSHDAYVESNAPDVATGTHHELSIGYHWDPNQKGRTRTYIRFDLPSLPAGANITSASVNLYEYSAYEVTAPYQTNLYRVDSLWYDSVYWLTWNQQPVVGAYQSSATVPQCYDCWNSWDATGLVQSWYAGSAANHGVMIRASDEYDHGAYFCSQDSAGFQTCQGNEPYLYINYTTSSPTPTATPYSNFVMSFDPANPVVGQTFTVWIHGEAASYVELGVDRWQYVEHYHEGQWVAWPDNRRGWPNTVNPYSWIVRASQPGPYTFTFYRNCPPGSGCENMAQGAVDVLAPTPTSLPTFTPMPTHTPTSLPTFTPVPTHTPTPTPVPFSINSLQILNEGNDDPLPWDGIAMDTLRIQATGSGYNPPGSVWVQVTSFTTGKTSDVELYFQRTDGGSHIYLGSSSVENIVNKPSELTAAAVIFDGREGEPDFDIVQSFLDDHLGVL